MTATLTSHIRKASLAAFEAHVAQTFAHYKVSEAAMTFPIVRGVTVRKHLEGKREAIKTARNLPKLTEAVTKAKDSVLTTALYLWAKGRAEGPNANDPIAIERRARSADSIAKMHDKIARKTGDEAAADRADAMRARAKELRATIASNSKEEWAASAAAPVTEAARVVVESAPRAPRSLSPRSVAGKARIDCDVCKCRHYVRASPCLPKAVAA